MSAERQPVFLSEQERRAILCALENMAQDIRRSAKPFTPQEKAGHDMLVARIRGDMKEWGLS